MTPMEMTSSFIAAKLFKQNVTEEKLLYQKENRYGDYKNSFLGNKLALGSIVVAVIFKILYFLVRVYLFSIKHY